MDWNGALLLLMLASSLVTGVAIFFLTEERHNWRNALNLTGAIIKLALIMVIVWGVTRGETYEVRYALLGDLDLVLRVDPLSLLFLGLSATLWLLTTIYAIGYLEESPNRSRFFGFFSLCVTATVGIALSGNLITFVLFYEMLTVVTYPMVVHRGTPESLAAGRTYLIYTLAGGTTLLIAVVWLHALAGPVEFISGGSLTGLEQEHWTQLTVIFALLMLGLGVKAVLVPLHGWLPEAMVAPAPVSALLHAVAVVKAGAFGIIRVVHDTYGIELALALGVLTPLAIVASVTIVYGSLRALVQNDLKRRLAFSTVSQLSYITLGAVMFGPLATTGALVHLVHQGVMKITLFYCAGNLAETLGIHRVSELNGVGRRMPITMTAFTIGALGMIGLPPTAGFISKWHLGLGALEAGQEWAIFVLAASSLLNAAYFLPVVYSAWFRRPSGPWLDMPHHQDTGPLETTWTLLAPSVATACLALMMGLMAASPFAPLDLARLVIGDLYQ